ncbi:MarC family protein [Sphingomonas sp.]|uniref:MarC family protein n=1 Tax=Sphingomonas sp. TaxID=28214 RepID=UPI003B00BB97
MLSHFLSAFVTLFVVIDPPGCAPIFAGLTGGASARQRRGMALRSTFIAALILFAFALIGEPLLKVLGISLDAFRIAGGIMLFLIALEMVFEKRTQKREERASKVAHSPEPVEDISVFPMAMPMIAGPGSIASAMLLMGRSHGLTEHATVLAALGAVLMLMVLALLAAGTIMRAVGPRVEGVITRLLGVLLAALAAQYVVDGVGGAFR